MPQLGPFPVIKRRVRTTTFATSAINLTPTNFGWFRGLTILTMNDNTTNYSWTIQLNGGQASHSNDPGMFVTYLYGTGFDNTNTPITVTMPMRTSPQTAGVDTITVTTNAPDSRTYVLTFSPYISVAPTISKTAGANFTTTATLTSIAYTANAYGIT